VIEIVSDVSTPSEISVAASRIRAAAEEAYLSPDDVIRTFEEWSKGLEARELGDIPGIVFLRIWLRRGSLAPIIARELGAQAMHGGWDTDGSARLRAFPIGVVGHWPAGNIEIQPILSLTCALLGGNASLVRIPTGLVDVTRRMMAKLGESDSGRILARRIHLAAFDHDRQDLQEAMAQSVDGAMIWGGQESVLRVRSLPFPHWARLSVFGPRVSVAAMDAATWGDPAGQAAWCLRLARDVWQFDQQACSSPQVLFLEKKAGQSTTGFLQVLRQAFEAENKAHPRPAIAASLTSAICRARASWLMESSRHEAIFPEGPDWTLLVGSGSEIPSLVQGKTLTVLEVDDLGEAISKFDGNVQTLGLGMADSGSEEAIARLAGRRGVDRIVKLGRMHVFVPPWDGTDLIRPMVRMVRHVSSAE
jgi:hypothetical protein